MKKLSIESSQINLSHVLELFLVIQTMEHRTPLVIMSNYNFHEGYFMRTMIRMVLLLGHRGG